MDKPEKATVYTVGTARGLDALRSWCIVEHAINKECGVHGAALHALMRYIIIDGLTLGVAARRASIPISQVTQLLASVLARVTALLPDIDSPAVLSVVQSRDYRTVKGADAPWASALVSTLDGIDNTL